MNQWHSKNRIFQVRKIEKNELNQKQRTLWRGNCQLTQQRFHCSESDRWENGIPSEKMYLRCLRTNSTSRGRDKSRCKIISYYSYTYKLFMFIMNNFWLYYFEGFAVVIIDISAILKFTLATNVFACSKHQL